MKKSKVIFANMINEIMTAKPGPVHARGLNLVSPRKIWLAEPGDIVVTPRPVSREFSDYALSILGVEPGSISTFSPDATDIGFLSSQLVASAEYARLKGLIRERGAEAFEFFPFALDRRAVALGRDLGLPVCGYEQSVSPEVIDLIFSVNTKSGFRAIADELAIPVPKGRSVKGLAAVAAAVRDLRGETGAAIVKFDRSSNGYGHVILDETACSDAGLEERLASRVAQWPEQPLEFTVEVFLPFISVPSVEISVTRNSVDVLYLCDQRCPNHSFAGMVSEAQSLTGATRRRAVALALKFGEYVRARGYRGVCDVDYGLLDSGDIVATESNFRRTGGTYLDALMRRFFGDGYASHTLWAADVRLLGENMAFGTALGRLEEGGLAFSRELGEGVILTADTVGIDRKLRTLTIAGSFERMAELETAVHQAFQ